MKKIILSFFLLCIIYTSGYSQRYLSPVFSGTNVLNNIQYGSAINYLGNTESLLLDFYEPLGDSLNSRPLLIYIHGGGFTNPFQTKTLVHIVAFCDSMARRGYVTASIDYRLDISISNRAVINAMHDAKAAVRFFKANSATYGIDTSLIFIGGESAGAVTALNNNYVNEPNETAFPPTWPYANDTTVEGNSGNPGYSSATKATLCYCGGTKSIINDLMFDTLNIKYATDAPLLMVHGTNDPLIPINRAVEVAIRATNVGLPNLFYTLPGATHCPWVNGLPNSWEYLDTLISYTVPFIYACIQTTDIIESEENTDFTISPNPNTGLLTINFNEGLNQKINISVIDIKGSEVFKLNNLFVSDYINLNLESLPKGVYVINLQTNFNQILSKQIIIK